MNTFVTFNAIQNIPTSSAALLGKCISLLFTLSNTPRKNYSFFKFSFYSFPFQVFHPLKKAHKQFNWTFYNYE